MSGPHDITRLLIAVNDEREGAMDALMAAVHTDLEAMARHHMNAAFGPGLPGITLEPAALLNDSYLTLIKQRCKYDDRGHFFAIATKVMLRVLVDYQRGRRTAKRGGERRRVTLSLSGPAAPAGEVRDDRRMDVDQLIKAVARLDSLDRRKADVVKLRVVWGLQIEEIARSLGISHATVERDWAFSKAWLNREASGTRSGTRTGPLPVGLAGGASRSSEGHHPSGYQAVERAGDAA